MFRALLSTFEGLLCKSGWASLALAHLVKQLLDRVGSLPAGYQMIFVPSCTVRFPPAPVMKPNVLLLMFVSGLFQLGVFTTEKLSPRSCSESRSVTLNVRNTERLMSQDPGPLITMGPRFPNCRAAGWPN